MSTRSPRFIARSRGWPFVAALLLAGTSLVACGEAEPDVTPVVATGPRRPIEEPPSPYVTNPHANLRDRSARERAAEQAAIEREAAGSGGAGGGGGGGGGAARPDFNPRPADPPTARELEAYRRELERQAGSRVDPSEDPCAQLRDVLAATVHAQDTPGSERPSVPSTRDMMSPCRELPREMQQCLDRTYFNQHMDECTAAFDRLGRRGRRISRNAREQLEAARANDGVLPGRRAEPEPDEDMPIVPDALLEPEDTE